MNWFKIAQIWNRNNKNGTLDAAVVFLYELEYKRQMLMSRQFHGVPQRRENILRNIEDQLRRSIIEVKTPLIKTFASWLKYHAINNPSEWASSRMKEDMEDSSPSELFTNFLYDYARHEDISESSIRQKPDNTAKVGNSFNNVIARIAKDMGSYPSLEELIVVLREDYKTTQIDELESFGYKEYGEQVGKKFLSKKQALDYIEDTKTINDDADLFYNYASGLGADSFIDNIETIIDPDLFIEELYAKLVFPLWYSYWQEQGIDETRENIKKVYDMLIQESSDIPLNIVVISTAINTAHQTGSMMDYLEQYGGVEIGRSIKEMRKLLNTLSNDNWYIPIWDKELQEVGVGLNEPNSTQLVSAKNNWYKKAQNKIEDEPPEWSFPEAGHDFSPDWDYERDLSPDPVLAKIVSDVILNINIKILPEIGMGKAKEAYIVEEGDILGRYAFGTAPYPVFLINLKAISEASKKYHVNIGIGISTTIYHELGHAIQDWMGMELNEEQAEDFARTYHYYGEIYEFWETGQRDN